MTRRRRTSDRQVAQLLLDRWSPRAFDESDMDDKDIRLILEGARWAPSAFNYQPWRFIYAHRKDAVWADFLSLLMPFNASWAARASIILFIVSDTAMEDRQKPLYSHSFDAGAVWAYLALQATAAGFHAHAMTGIQFDRARAQLNVPDDFRIEAAVALGRLGDPALLPEALRLREVPSDRKPIDEIVYHGRFSCQSNR